MEIWSREDLSKFVTTEWGAIGGRSVMEQIQGWIDRGDGAAIYRNHDLGHPDVGMPKIVSYGSKMAQLEVAKPPEQLPDIGGEINWRFQLEAVYGGPASKPMHESGKPNYPSPEQERAISDTLRKINGENHA
jgi:hypothetical protein